MCGRRERLEHYNNSHAIPNLCNTKEVILKNAFPWTCVTQIKQRANENPLEYVAHFHLAYENYCAANNANEVYNSAIVIESATSGQSKEYGELLIIGSVHILNWDSLH